jgi:hypothetical protein
MNDFAPSVNKGGKSTKRRVTPIHAFRSTDSSRTDKEYDALLDFMGENDS